MILPKVICLEGVQLTQYATSYPTGYWRDVAGSLRLVTDPHGWDIDRDYDWSLPYGERYGTLQQTVEAEA